MKLLDFLFPARKRRAEESERKRQEDIALRARSLSYPVWNDRPSTRMEAEIDCGV